MHRRLAMLPFALAILLALPSFILIYLSIRSFWVWQDWSVLVSVNGPDDYSSDGLWRMSDFNTYIWLGRGEICIEYMNEYVADSTSGRIIHGSFHLKKPLARTWEFAHDLEPDPISPLDPILIPPIHNSHFGFGFGMQSEKSPITMPAATLVMTDGAVAFPSWFAILTTAAFPCIYFGRRLKMQRKSARGFTPLMDN